jgi:hypothetical protein
MLYILGILKRELKVSVKIWARDELCKSDLWTVESSCGNVLRKRLQNTGQTCSNTIEHATSNPSRSKSLISHFGWVAFYHLLAVWLWRPSWGAAAARRLGLQTILVFIPIFFPWAWLYTLRYRHDWWIFSCLHTAPPSGTCGEPSSSVCLFLCRPYETAMCGGAFGWSITYVPLNYNSFDSRTILFMRRMNWSAMSS